MSPSLASSMSFRWLAPILVLALAGFTGCAGVEKGDRSRTGGRTLVLQHWIPAEQKCEYYSIDRNGTFGASGGRAAEFKEITWTTPLTDAQIAEFLGPPSERAWWDAVEAASKASDDAPGAEQRPRTALDFRGPAFNRSLNARGRVPQIEALLEAMRKLAMGRFAPELDALPRAGERF